MKDIIYVREYIIDILFLNIGLLSMGRMEVIPYILNIEKQLSLIINRDCRGRMHMVIGFITTYTISDYHH